jgi:hypothetical protein
LRCCFFHWCIIIFNLGEENGFIII